MYRLKGRLNGPRGKGKEESEKLVKSGKWKEERERRKVKKTK